MKKTVSLIAHGRVQGVGFRYSTQNIAQKMKILGTVKNNLDGTVSIEAQAEESILNDFIEKIKMGPSSFAKVSQLDISYISNQKNYTNFDVIG